jgi:hypothetical protein
MAESPYRHFIFRHLTVFSSSFILPAKAALLQAYFAWGGALLQSCEGGGWAMGITASMRLACRWSGRVCESAYCQLDVR